MDLADIYVIIHLQIVISKYSRSTLFFGLIILIANDQVPYFPAYKAVVFTLKIGLEIMGFVLYNKGR